MNCKELDVFTITTHTYKGTGAQLIQELRFNIDCRSVKYLHFAKTQLDQGLAFYRSASFAPLLPFLQLACALASISHSPSGPRSFSHS